MSLDVTLTKPGCPHCGASPAGFSANITHNLGEMADAAGIYDQVWRPEENYIEYAYEMIPHLRAGIRALKSDPARFKRFDAENGWGTYDQFVPWLEAYLEACVRMPEAKVKVSR